MTQHSCFLFDSIVCAFVRTTAVRSISFVSLSWTPLSVPHHQPTPTLWGYLTLPSIADQFIDHVKPIKMNSSAFQISNLTTFSSRSLFYPLESWSVALVPSTIVLYFLCVAWFFISDGTNFHQLCPHSPGYGL